MQIKQPWDSTCQIVESQGTSDAREDVEKEEHSSIPGGIARW